MAKFLKDTPVFMACPGCGRTQRAKLKWAKHHKSLKCKDCRETIDLRKPPASAVIAKTAYAVTQFERTLDEMRAAAERQRKLHKQSRKKAKKKGKKKHAKAAKRSTKVSKPAAAPLAKPPAAAAQPKPPAAAPAPQLKQGQWPA